MRPSLDENTRSALHFTLLGLGLVGGARLAYWWVGKLLLDGHPGSAFLLPWRAGYLLADPYTVVHAAPTLPLRLAVAVGYALLSGALAAVIASAFRIPAWVAVGRVVGLVVLPMALASALVFPPRSATPDPTTGSWRVCERTALPGGLTLPGTARCTTIEVDTVHVHLATDAAQLMLGGRVVAEAPHTGVALIDSTRAALAVEVLDERLGTRRPR